MIPDSNEKSSDLRERRAEIDAIQDDQAAVRLDDSWELAMHNEATRTQHRDQTTLEMTPWKDKSAMISKHKQKTDNSVIQHKFLKNERL